VLALLFYLGNECYALDADEVIEVIPAVNTRSVPHAPDYVAGLLNFRGRILPVLDMCQLTQKRACKQFLSTRIAVVDFADQEGRRHLVGLMAERVTETSLEGSEAAVVGGMEVAEAPYLGPVALGNSGVMVQRIRVDKLLPKALVDSLYAEEEALMPANVDGQQG
jgi:chemotaxis-related protein WspB